MLDIARAKGSSRTHKSSLVHPEAQISPLLKWLYEFWSHGKTMDGEAFGACVLEPVMCI